MPYRQYSRFNPKRYILLALVKLGRRGVALLLFGSMYLLQGAVVLAGGNDFGPDWLNEVRGIAWIIAGGLALAHAPRRQGNDVVGFYALMTMGLWLTGVSLMQFVLWMNNLDQPGHGFPTPYGLPAAVTYGVMLIGVPMYHLGWRENIDHTTGGFE